MYNTCIFPIIHASKLLLYGTVNDEKSLPVDFQEIRQGKVEIRRNCGVHENVLQPFGVEMAAEELIFICHGPVPTF